MKWAVRSNWKRESSLTTRTLGKRSKSESEHDRRSRSRSKADTNSHSNSRHPSSTPSKPKQRPHSYATRQNKRTSGISLGEAPNPNFFHYPYPFGDQPRTLKYDELATIVPNANEASYWDEKILLHPRKVLLYVRTLRKTTEFAHLFIDMPPDADLEAEYEHSKNTGEDRWRLFLAIELTKINDKEKIPEYDDERYIPQSTPTPSAANSSQLGEALAVSTKAIRDRCNINTSPKPPNTAEQTTAPPQPPKPSAVPNRANNDTLKLLQDLISKQNEKFGVRGVARDGCRLGAALRLHQHAPPN